MVVRSDTAGATHRFAQACRDRGVGFSFGFPVDARVWDAVDTLSLANGWYPAIDSSGDLRDGAWVAEATSLVNLSTWPPGTRLILRKERPHPGAQLRFTDIDGMRITAFITDTTPGAVPGQLAGLELRHRQHARVEDRIREAKAAGLANLPCHDFDANAAWLEIVLTAADLVAWAQLIGFTHAPELARCEINAFRYRARWQPEQSQIEMALVSQRGQQVELAGQLWSFAEGEALITETSAKYSPEAFLALAASAGWRGAERWSDPAGDLSLHLLVQAD